MCDNIVGNRWSPDAVHTAKDLEVIDKLAVLKAIPAEQCWSDTYAEPFGTKWIDINKGDGDRVEVRSRLEATEMKVHQVKMGTLCDVLFCAAQPLEAVRLIVSLMMIDKNQVKPCNTMVH